MSLPQARVRYKRLETTGSYCNVEVEAEITFEHGPLGNKEIDNAVAVARISVDKEIVAAKQRRREEEEAEDRARCAADELKERLRKADNLARARASWKKATPPGLSPIEEIAFIGKYLDNGRAVDGYTDPAMAGVGLRRAESLLKKVAVDPASDHKAAKESVGALHVAYGRFLEE